MSLFTLVIHGGAGTIRREEMDPELEQRYRNGLEESLSAGYGILEQGGSALDAVRRAVCALEDNILFNAGRGSVFTRNGLQEMDASIMDGSNRRAGAVAAVRNIRNPVELACAVMTNSPHVMLNGEGAMDFARLQGLVFEPDEYFFSEYRYEQWKQLQDSDATALDHQPISRDKKFGTVGAVAMDLHGNIAAATSTGGMTNKQFGRVGDSPIIGAGTYANNHTCAISCTGHGEPFIRAVTAYDVSCLMAYKGLTLQQAMERVVFEHLPRLEGEGGMIGVDAKGNAAMVFNSEGMYRGLKASDGRFEISIYK